MNQLSEKELSALNDLLSEEELLIKKFQMLAKHTEDQEISAKFTEIAISIRDILTHCMHSCRKPADLDRKRRREIYHDRADIYRQRDF